jgi:hypothetical protein
MSQAEMTKRREGLARRNAREAVEREAAQRELQEKLRKIEILKRFSQTQFSRLNRTIVSAALWLVVLAILFGVVGWYSSDVMKWAIGLVK